MNPTQIISLRPLLVGITALLSISGALGQENTSMLSQQSTFRIMPTYQHWKIGDEGSFSQASVGALLYSSLSRDASFTLFGTYAGTSGDVADLRGLSDVQASVNYYFERPGLMLSCGIGLPIGKKQLSGEEFETSILASNEVFDLQSPSLGQGLRMQPGLAWAKPFGERFSLGLGVSFQFRGAYKPLEDYGDYDPGEEALLTGGFEVRISESNSIAFDLVFTSYGTDKLDGVEVFSAGEKTSVNLLSKNYIGHGELLLQARYRTRGKNDLAYAGALESENEKFTPDQIEFLAEYKAGVTHSLTMHFQGHARAYQESPSEFSGVRLFGGGVLAEIQSSETISIPVRMEFGTGTIKGERRLTGVHVGVGIAVRLGGGGSDN